MTKYRCPMLGECNHADSGEVFERVVGDDLKCPGCQHLLEVHRPPTRLRLLVGNPARPYRRRGRGRPPRWRRFLVSTSQACRSAESVPVAAATPRPATTGIAPSEAELQKKKQESEAGLVAGQAAGAEAKSAAAAANEMIKLGIAKLAQGKLDESEKAFRGAVDLDPKESLGYYNMAILRLRQGRQDDAFKELEASFMAGFKWYFDKMQQDTDLDPLRKDPRFAELLKRYQFSGK